MPFSLETIEQRAFSSWDELNTYVNEEEEKYKQVPVEQFLSNNGRFTNDRFFGYKGCWVKFNDEGMDAFCKLTNIPFHFLDKLNETGLISTVLNNYITLPEVRDKLSRYRFVIDEQNMTVMGLVSITYVTYSNKKFLEDLMHVFPSVMLEFEIEESYAINTNLHLRLLSPNYNVGFPGDLYGTKEDTSRIGIQLTNGMTGRSSIKASYFVYRLVCLNGLIVPCQTASGVVMHSGKPETFLDRISKNITPVFEKLKDVPDMIKELGSIEFNREKFVELGGAQFIYNIIPLSYWEQTKRNKLRGAEKTSFDLEKIDDYIRKYSGDLSEKVFLYRQSQTMFDFVNIFTEYAQIQNYRERTKIEEKTGEMANWIASRFTEKQLALFY
jgi:hypothetical protein